MKENYLIYLPCQLCFRALSLDRDTQLPNKKMKTLFLYLEYVKKSNTDFDFFPDKIQSFNEKPAVKNYEFMSKSYSVIFTIRKIYLGFKVVVQTILAQSL